MSRIASKEHTKTTNVENALDRMSEE
jgi:hypothetical protein